MTADFHRLNVVLVRGETDPQKHVIGRKVATATVTAAHVWATLGIVTQDYFELSKISYVVVLISSFELKV